MTKRDFLKAGVAALGVAVFGASAWAGSWKQLTPAEMVETFPVIVTGKVVVREQREIEPGVFAVTHYVQVTELLQGTPEVRELTWAGQAPVRTVAFKTVDGPKASSRKYSYPVGTEGTWLLVPASAPGESGLYVTSSPQLGDAAELKALIETKGKGDEPGR